MSDVRTSIQIAAPPEAVWDVVMDVRRTHEWVTIHRRLKDHSDGPARVGFQMRQTLCLRGVPFDVKWELRECQPPHLAVWEGRGPAHSRASIVDRMTPQDGGTRFDYSNHFHAPLGPLGAVASRVVMGGVPQHEADASLRRLKAIVERSRAA